MQEHGNVRVFWELYLRPKRSAILRCGAFSPSDGHPCNGKWHTALLDLESNALEAALLQTCHASVLPRPQLSQVNVLPVAVSDARADALAASPPSHEPTWMQ